MIKLKEIWQKILDKGLPPEFDEKLHKDCPECVGTGRDGIDSCYNCEGKGFVSKTLNDIYNSPKN